MTTLDKAAWRTRIRSARRIAAANGSPAEIASGLAQAALGWLETLDGDTTVVCAYISTGAEPPTEQLLEALCESGRTVYVPVCEPGYQLSWVLWHKGVAMVPSLLAPVQEAVGQRHAFEELGTPSTLFIPALAVAADGVRLGQGGGYYDRFLRIHAGDAAVAAVVFDDELLPAGTLPHDGLDVFVRFALTSAGHFSMGQPPV